MFKRGSKASVHTSIEIEKETPRWIAIRLRMRGKIAINILHYEIFPMQYKDFSEGLKIEEKNRLNFFLYLS